MMNVERTLIELHFVGLTQFDDFLCTCLVQQMALPDGVLVVLPLFCWYPVRTYNMLRHLIKLETWFWIAGVELLVSIAT